MTLALVPFQHHAVMKWTNVHDSLLLRKSMRYAHPPCLPAQSSNFAYWRRASVIQGGRPRSENAGLRATFHCRLPQGSAGAVPLESALGGPIWSRRKTTGTGGSCHVRKSVLELLHR